MTHQVLIGDLGCPGVDTEAWKKANRVKLYPGKVNRWVVARTLRDKPTTDDVRTTLNAVFSKWFEGIGIDPGLAAAADMLSSSEDEATPGKVTGKRGASSVVDGVRIVAATTGAEPPLPDTAERRETLPMVPLPTLNPEAGVIFLVVDFNYWGLVDNIPWPVRTAPGWTGTQLQSTADCPIGADWMLVASGKPLGDAPHEKGWVDVFTDKAGDILSRTVKPAVDELKWPLYVGAGLLGLYLVVRAKEAFR